MTFYICLLGTCRPCTSKKRCWKDTGTGWKCLITKDPYLCHKDLFYEKRLVALISFLTLIQIYGWKCRSFKCLGVKQIWYSHEALPSLIPCGQCKKAESQQSATPCIPKSVWGGKGIVYREIQKGNYSPREQSKPLIKLGVKNSLLLKSYLLL